VTALRAVVRLAAFAARVAVAVLEEIDRELWSRQAVPDHVPDHWEVRR
jgi:hypothetical protein